LSKNLPKSALVFGALRQSLQATFLPRRVLFQARTPPAESRQNPLAHGGFYRRCRTRTLRHWGRPRR